MKNIILTSLVVLVLALGVGYYLGQRKPQSGNDQQPQNKISMTPEDMVSEKYGHVHSALYIPETNTLLIGSHMGLFKSIDNGKTTAKIDTKTLSEDFMSLVLDSKDHKTIFAGGHDLGVVKSTDGGNTWVKSDSGINGTDIHGLAINQRNPDYLFAYSVGNGLFRSVDKGNNWKRMDDGPDNPSVRGLAYLSVQTVMDKSMGWDNWGLLVAGTGGGVFQSFSCFCGWTKPTSQFDNTTVYSLANQGKDSKTLYASTQAGVWRSTDEGKTWKQINSGIDDMKIASISINPNKPSEVFAVSEAGQVFRSVDGGNNWLKI